MDNNFWADVDSLDDDGYIHTIILKRTELPQHEKYHGLSRDDEYDTVCTQEGLGMAMGAVPLSYEEIETVADLPQVEAIFADKTIAFPEPVDMHATRSPEVVVENVDFAGAPKVWDRTKGKGTRAAVLDTGLDETHARITFNKNNVRHYNFTDSDTSLDKQGHGTWVCGAVCGPNNYGMAPEAELVNIKVLNDSGSGWYSWIIAGLDQALKDGCHVANLSLGGPGTKNSPLNLAINAATRRGMGVVVAAGNEQRGSTAYTADASIPASAAGAITVAAMDIREELAPFSNWGRCLDLAALGVQAEGFGLRGTVGRKMSGTSMASPYVAGAYALIRSLLPSDSKHYEIVADVKRLLYASAQDTRYKAYQTGHGRLDVDAATRNIG